MPHDAQSRTGEDETVRTTGRSYPLLRAVLAQIAAAAAVLIGLHLFGGPAEPGIPLPLILIAQGTLAAVLGQLSGLAKWWLPINLVLPGVVVLVLSLNLPGWLWPLVFLALALVFWNSADERVPLYLTNRATWRALEELVRAESGGELKVADIGCGLGGALLHLARQSPAATFVGVESAPLPFAIARIRLTFSGLTNLSIEYGDLWKRSFADCDLVYCFLSPEPMPRLYRKLKQEMKPGSRLVSNSFQVPELEANEIVEVDDRRRTRLLIYRF